MRAQQLEKGQVWALRGVQGMGRDVRPPNHPAQPPPVVFEVDLGF